MYRSKEVTTKLKISPATLRLWTTAFAELLSPGASGSQTESGSAGWRSFTQEDLAILSDVKSLLAQDRTYEHALAVLKSGEPIEAGKPLAETQAEATEPSSSPAIVTETHPIIQAFEEALKAKDETIKAKEQTIEQLLARIDELKAQPAPKPIRIIEPPKFRWEWLTRLLTGSSQHVG